MYLLQKSTAKVSSRRQIDIKGVRDGILMLPGDAYRLVLEVSSVNFELKSEDEQDALIDAYQSFLNSLSCGLQIIIRVREMDLDKYIDDLEARLAGEPETVYQQQIKHYSSFVRGLVSSNKILSRRFYVVVPYEGDSETDFEFAREQLYLNCDIVGKGLSRLGMQTYSLNSLEILDLFYSFYNPSAAKRQPLQSQALQLLNTSLLAQKELA
jgi:hypothetical protein